MILPTSSDFKIQVGLGIVTYERVRAFALHWARVDYDAASATLAVAWRRQLVLELN